MGILGVGIDVLAVDRVRRLATSPRFVHRWFGSGERAACLALPDPAVGLAEHLASKEAVWKALGFGEWSGGVPWRQILVTRTAGRLPQQVELCDQVAVAASQIGVRRVGLDWQEVAGIVIAIAIAED